MPNSDQYIDWQVLERKRIEEEKRNLATAIGELKSKVAMLDTLRRTSEWQLLTQLLQNTVSAKQSEAMKATDPTSMARAFGYMAATLDIINLPATLAQQLESQLANLTT